MCMNVVGCDFLSLLPTASIDDDDDAVTHMIACTLFAGSIFPHPFLPYL